MRLGDRQEHRMVGGLHQLPDKIEVGAAVSGKTDQVSEPGLLHMIGTGKGEEDPFAGKAPEGLLVKADISFFTLPQLLFRFDERRRIEDDNLMLLSSFFQKIKGVGLHKDASRQAVQSNVFPAQVQGLGRGVDKCDRPGPVIERMDAEAACIAEEIEDVPARRELSHEGSVFRLIKVEAGLVA